MKRLDNLPDVTLIQQWAKTPKRCFISFYTNPHLENLSLRHAYAPIDRESAIRPSSFCVPSYFSLLIAPVRCLKMSDFVVSL